MVQGRLAGWKDLSQRHVKEEVNTPDKVGESNLRLWPVNGQKLALH